MSDSMAEFSNDRMDGRDKSLQMLKPLIIIGFFLFLIPSALAVKEVKTVSYFGGFVADATANTNYTRTFNFKSPDGLTNIYYAKVTMRLDTTTTNTRIYAQLNGSFCTPNYYDIPSAISDYSISFDCTDIVNIEGIYIGGFQANKNIKNVFVEWDFTYLNNPPSQVASIGGTEYSAHEPARIVLQMINNEGNPINNGTCFTTIRDNNDVIKADNQSLNYISDSNGLYYYQFTTSLPVGVYSTDNYCIFNGNKIYSGDTFHIAEWTEMIKKIGQPFIKLFGTDYAILESGKIFVQLYNTTNPITNATCFVTIYKPDNTLLVNNSLMNNFENGFFTFDFTAPDVTGIYMTFAKCYLTTATQQTIVTTYQLDDGGIDDWYQITSNSKYFSNNYTVSDISGIQNAEVCVHEYNSPDDTTGIVVIDQTEYPQYTLDFNMVDNWKCAQIPANLVLQGTHLYGFKCSNCATNKKLRIGYDSGVSDSWIYSQGSWSQAGQTFYIRLNVTKKTTEMINETIYTPSVDSAEIHVTPENTKLSFIGGTEYVSGEKGTFSLQFTKIRAGNQQIIDDGSCEGTFYYPNGTLWMEDVNFPYLGSDGIYYNITDIPKTKGTYTISVLCQWHGIDQYSSHTFHVSEWGEGLMNMTINGTLINEYYLLFAGGTEYEPNEEGTFVVQFLRTVAGNPSPVSGGTCNINIYFPNMTMWKNNLNLPELSGSNALYFNRSILPEVYGVYTIEARCTKGGITAYNTHTFHVAKWAKQIYNMTDLILEHNQSVWNKLYIIQGELQNITDILISLNISLGNVSFDTSKLEQMITSVNDTVISTNATVMWKLYSIQDELAEINQSIENHDINVLNNLSYIQNELSDIAIYLEGHNTTVMWKLYKIQDELADINQTMNVQHQEIYNYLQNFNLTMDNYYSNVVTMLNSFENNVYNNFTYTNWLIQNLSFSMNYTYFDEKFYNLEYNINSQINTTWMDLRSYIDVRYESLNTAIYECCQKWQDMAEDTLNQLLGTAESLDRMIGQTTGVTPACSLTDRILGRC